MTRVDFHVNVSHRLNYACRVARKARASDKRMLIYARDAQRLAQMDAALWTFSALDFLPHVYVDSPLAAVTPILLTLRIDAAPASDVLLTLDDEFAPEFAAQVPRFERVIEIVAGADDDRARGRLRFKAYRELGYQPTTHTAAADE